MRRSVWLVVLLTALESGTAASSINKSAQVFPDHLLRKLTDFATSHPLVQGNTLGKSFSASRGLGIAFNNESWGLLQRAFPAFHVFASRAVAEHRDSPPNVFYANVLIGGSQGSSNADSEHRPIADWHFDNTIENVVSWSMRLNSHRMDWGERMWGVILRDRAQCRTATEPRQHKPPEISPERVAVLYLDTVHEADGGALCVELHEGGKPEVRCSQPAQNTLLEFQGDLRHKVEALNRQNSSQASITRRSLVLEQYLIPHAVAKKLFNPKSPQIYVVTTEPQGAKVVTKVDASSWKLDSITKGSGWMLNNEQGSWQQY